MIDKLFARFPVLKENALPIGIMAIGIITLILFGACSTPKGTVSVIPPDRFDGDDRFGTSVAVSEYRYPGGADHVYLAVTDVSVGTYADALIGVPLDGPVLLVPTCGEIPSSIRDEIVRLSPDTVTAIGGEGAICESLLQEAKLLTND